MREIININRKWAFTKRFDEIPREVPKDWDFVSLPHTWNGIDGQDGGNDYYRGKCCYVKKIERTSLPDADRYYIEINGANSSADLYADGKRLAHHDGGYSAWRVDITDEIALSPVIAFVVDNSENKAVYPQTADFTFYGGLYRDVNIIAVSSSHFDLDYYGGPGIKITPRVDIARETPVGGLKKAGAGIMKMLRGLSAVIKIESYPAASEGKLIKYVIKDADGSVVNETVADAENSTVEIPIKNVHLWNGVDDPYLYTCEAYIVTLKQPESEENNKKANSAPEYEIYDNVTSRFGVRSFEIDPEAGFILNGREYPLRGVARHQDRWEIGNALRPEHQREDMELICELGANSVRLAHYQHDRYFYDLCDERGIIVWAEIPYISAHIPEGRENTVSQLTELIIQNYNHPSIAVWALSNEITIRGTSSDLVENHVVLNGLAHRLDPTRKTVVAAVSSNDVHSPYLQIPDAVAYNHYFGWYGGETDMYGKWFDEYHAEFPNIPIGISEYGCEALNWHTSDPRQGDYTEEYQAQYHEEVIKQLFPRKYIWCSYVWNMFDFGADGRNEGGENGQNHKGLVTIDRKYKKDAFYAYKAWLSKEPFVHICGKRYVDRVESVTRVTVYSNQPEVELYVNGKSIGKQKNPGHFFYFSVPIDGITKIRATAGSCSDESEIRRVDSPNDSYRLADNGAVLNWFDVTERDGYLSLNSKISDIMQTNDGKALIDELLGKAEGSPMMPDKDSMLRMIGGFTLLRLCGMMGGIELGKDELLEINEKLNQIPQMV